MLATIGPNHRQTVDIIDSLGRIGAGDCIAENIAVFCRSAMDGYAVRAADIQDRSAQMPRRILTGKSQSSRQLLAGD